MLDADGIPKVLGWVAVAVGMIEADMVMVIVDGIFFRGLRSFNGL